MAEDYARFEALGRQDVADLLRTHEVGRIGWNSSEGPVILPVAYAFDRDRLAFRTAAHGLLAELATPTATAFQVDEFDVETATGWSVLVRAISALVTEGGEVGHWLNRLPTPWAPGPRELVIRLDPVQLSGRMIVRG